MPAVPNPTPTQDLTSSLSDSSELSWQGWPKASCSFGHPGYIVVSPLSSHIFILLQTLRGSNNSSLLLIQVAAYEICAWKLLETHRAESDSWNALKKKKTCKSTAERNNTRIMQKSPPVIMSVPVQTNSDISRQIFLFNRVSKIFGLIWGLNKVFWNTLQPGTRKCGKLNGKPWWQMAYWEARKSMKTCGAAQQSPPEGRQDQKSSAAVHHGGSVHSGTQSIATEQCSNPFDIHISLYSSVCSSQGDPCNLMAYYCAK